MTRCCNTCALYGSDGFCNWFPSPSPEWILAITKPKMKPTDGTKCATWVEIDEMPF